MKKLPSIYCIVRNGQVDLLCRGNVPDKSGVIHGDVINGLWEFGIHPDGSFRAFDAFGKKAINYEYQIVTHPRLASLADDYNEAMFFMQRYISTASPVTRWLNRSVFALQYRLMSLKSLYKKFKRSCKAFNDVWHGRRSGYTDEDTIPF